jgi:hypothetical protein
MINGEPGQRIIHRTGVQQGDPPPPHELSFGHGARMSHPPEQVHNHNSCSVTLNCPCPVSRPRAVSHNRTKRKVVGPVSRITPCLSYPCRFTTHPSHPEWEPDPLWGPGGPPSIFFNIDEGIPGSLTALAKGAVIDVF